MKKLRVSVSVSGKFSDIILRVYMTQAMILYRCGFK